MRVMSCSFLWEVTCSCIWGLSAVKTCRLKDSGTIFSSVCSKRRRFIMRLPRFSGRLCSDAAGADMHAGRRWCLTCCRLSSREGERKQRLGLLRYLLFALSLVFAASLFLFGAENKERIMWYAFLIGNAVYYAAGIALAFAFKDNRAVLQIPLPDYCFFEAGKQSFADAYRGGCEKMCFMRKVPQGVPDECGAGRSI